jgi:hypothetical protein
MDFEHDYLLSFVESKKPIPNSRDEFEAGWDKITRKDMEGR